MTFISLEAFKAIAEALGLQRTTVRDFIHKWRNMEQWRTFPGVDQPPTFLQEHQHLIQEVTEEPRGTSKDLQTSLASVKVRLHDSTIRKTLEEMDPWESWKHQTTTDQKQHKGSSGVYKKTSG